MTDFQRAIKEKLNEIARGRNAKVTHSIYECEPNELIGHVAGDVYIESIIKLNDTIIKVYIYTDEASVQIDKHDFMIELPDYKHDVILLGKVLIDFMGNCLDREAPDVALEKARQQNGVSR